jgi:hypothetical protein
MQDFEIGTLLWEFDFGSTIARSILLDGDEGPLRAVYEPTGQCVSVRFMCHSSKAEERKTDEDGRGDHKDTRRT